MHCPSRFESIYLKLTLALDPEFPKQHRKDSANKNVT